MIFSKNFDRALWLLVASNKKDSDKVCNLIKNIPEYICENIQMAINNYYDDSIIYIGNYRDNECFDNYIVVKIEDDATNNINNLCITLYRWKEDIDRIEEEYNLILGFIDEHYLDSMLYFDKEKIGKYSSEFNNIKFLGCLTDVETTNYDRNFIIKRVLFGYVVSSCLSKIRFGGRYVNVNKNMPNEIFYDDFSSQEKIKSLVRKKK